MRKLKAIIKRPDEPIGREIEIDNDLHAFQACVGGYIEIGVRMGDALVICNEEGIILDLPYNLCLCGINLFGTVVVVGSAGEDFTDCPLTMKEWGKLVKEWNRV